MGGESGGAGYEGEVGGQSWFLEEYQFLMLGGLATVLHQKLSIL
ncbi:hypothetical protein [Rubritalea tangerina]